MNYILPKLQPDEEKDDDAVENNINN